MNKDLANSTQEPVYRDWWSAGYIKRTSGTPEPVYRDGSPMIKIITVVL